MPKYHEGQGDWLPDLTQSDPGQRLEHKIRWEDICYTRYLNAHAALRSAQAEYDDAATAWENAEAELNRERAERVHGQGTA